MRTAASIKSLMQIKDVTEEDAKAIRRIWHNDPMKKRAMGDIDAILRTEGVEYLGLHKRSGYNVYFCNGGDTYATTILFIGPRLVVGDIGSLMESGVVTDPVTD